MPAVAIIPVKSFSTGMQRLAEALSPTQRSALSKALVNHVSVVADKCGLIPIVVTSDTEVAVWSTEQGIPSVPDPGDGLDSAVGSGVEWAMLSDSRWVAIHSDLPLLREDDVTHLLDLATVHEVIAPSSDGGTSAIAASRRVRFAYGPGSFSTHLARLRDAAVVARTGFLHDVDSPTDLESARSHPMGRWIDRVLG